MLCRTVSFGCIGPDSNQAESRYVASWIGWNLIQMDFQHGPPSRNINTRQHLLAPGVKLFVLSTRRLPANSSRFPSLGLTLADQLPDLENGDRRQRVGDERALGQIRERGGDG
jgi:hypothetical protein